MNNVWTAIAFRAPCAARHAPRTPLLHLFTGYAKYRATNHARWKAESQLPTSTQSRTITSLVRSQPAANRPDSSKQTFSTTAVLSARKGNKPSARTQKPQPPSDSKLEPAPTVVSYTEGVLDQPSELTWRDYDPAGGMPIPRGERSQVQINGIFGGEDVDVENGNYVLNVMHWRRMSGALIDVGVEFPRDSGVTREQAMKGLEYVRSLDPGFDEQAAGEIWAEEESQRLQQELQERAVKLRLYKPDEQAVEEEQYAEPEPEEEQGTEYGRARNRESQLQRIREENEAKFELEQAQRATAEAKAEQSAMHTHRGPLELGGGVQPSVELVTYTGRDGIVISKPQTKAWLQPVERKPWVKYYEEQAQIIKENSVPQLSLLRRLGPSFLLLLFILSAALYLAENYTPPPRSARLFPDTPPAVATLTALTGSMAAFFVLSRFPPFWRTLSKYFTLTPAYPHALALIGCTFRHQPLSHLLINTISLWFFGLMLHEDVGRGAFLSIFFASGALGAYTSLVFHVLRANWTAYMFGSSGGVLGVVAATCVLHPNNKLVVFGQEIPVAVWVWLTLWGAAEVVAMFRFKGLGVDHAGHLGGLVGGFLAGRLVIRKAGEQQHFMMGRAEEDKRTRDIREVTATS